MEKFYLNHYNVEDVFPSPRLSKGFVERDYTIHTHTQNFYEVNIVMKGQAVHCIGQRKIPVKNGDTFIIPPNVPHSYEGGNGFDVYHLILHPKYLERYSSTLSLLPAFFALFRVDPLMREKTSSSLYFRLDEAEIFSLLPTLESLARKEHESDAANAITADAEAMIIIAALCSIYERKMPNTASTTVDKGFADSLAYIYEHYNERIEISDLCKMAKMSRSSYLNKFKRVTETSPIAFQNSYRIEMAKQLLTETSAPVSEISAKIGFYDTSHFIRIFKKETGLTPSHFRKKD